jgi:tetratricopeptide (TPR) repeat protein
MKIDNESLPSIPIADIKEINVGERAFFLVDPDHPKKGFTEGLVSDFKMFPGRLKGDELQYIQLATLTTTTTRGAVVDKNGKLIGLLLTQEKNINLAVPLQDFDKMVNEHKAIPVSELKNAKFSSDALNYYLQGILAEDAQKWDSAMEFFKRALALNPDLSGAHLELGSLYYKKQLFEDEAKEYQEALRINPNDVDAIFSLAGNFETRGYYKQAIREYEKGISLDPNDAITYYNLGVAYIADGRANKAMEIYPKLKTLDPGSAEMLKRLARGR